MALLCAVGCAPPYTIIRQAVPNPVLNARAFSVEPIHSEQLTVGSMPEGAYLAGKNPDQQQSYLADKQAMVQRFMERLATRSEGWSIIAGPPPAPDVFILRPILDYIEPGFYVGVASRATETRMRVQIIDQQGRVYDEVAVRAVIGASLYNPSTGGRLRSAADRMADYIHEYLKRRVRGQN